MRFDELPSAWQKENDKSLSPEDRDATIFRVCRRVERIGGTVLRRDLIETIAALFVIFWFGGMVLSADNLVSKIGAGFLVFWALFIIWKLHRTRTIQQPAPLDAPVHEFCRIELDRLDRQVQLLHSVLWWYIAPAVIGANLVFAGFAGLGVASRAYFIFTLLLAWGIYALNMRAIATELIPARNELANLLSQLEDGGPSTPIREDYRPSSTERPTERTSKLQLILAVVALLAALGYVAAVIVDETVEYPKRAPYTGIRWDGEQPVVKIGEEWFTLVSLDGVAAKDIVAFSRWTFGNKWRKRFEEDLVEVLTRMGYAPKDTVRLVVSPPGSSITRTLEDVPMTEANRQIIYDAALARERGAQQPEARTAIPIEDGALFRSRIEKSLGAA
jgi:hypothetical protein